MVVRGGSLWWFSEWFCNLISVSGFFFPPLLLFVVAAMVGGSGGCDMGGWIWWPVALGCERETLRKERERERKREE